MTGTDLLEYPTSTETDEGNIYAHYVWCPGEDAEAVILRSRVEGIPVTALCGYRWIPSRLAENYPVCPKCQSIKETSF